MADTISLILQYLPAFVVGGFFFLLAQYLLLKRGNKEYIEKVHRARDSVLHAMQSQISDNSIPSRDVIEALLPSTAKKFEVKENDVYTVDSLIDDLTREVMESVFLSAQTKKEYCENLVKIKSVQNKQQIEQASVNHQIQSISDETNTIISFLIAVLVALMAYLIFNIGIGFSLTFTIIAFIITLYIVAIIWTRSRGETPLESNKTQNRERR